MPTISGPSTFSNFIRDGVNQAQVKLNDQGKLETVGKRSTQLNIFERAWKSITRSSGEIQENKNTARALVREIQSKYGSEVAQIVAQGHLQDHLDKGRPLSDYRIQRVFDEAEQLCNQIQANNRQRLDEVIDSVTDHAIRHYNGPVPEGGLDRQSVMAAVRQAVEGSNMFRQMEFYNPLDDIFDMFGEDGPELALNAFVDKAKDLALLALQPGVQQALQNGWRTEDVTKFTPEELALLVRHDIGPEIGQQYKEKGIPIHERTMIGELRDERVVGQPQALGGGSMSKPFDVTYGEQRMVFKEPYVNQSTGIEVGYGAAAITLGIDKQHAQMTVRNLATKALDEALGFGVIPESRIGVLNGKVGLVMDYVEGLSPMRNEWRDTTEESWQKFPAMMGLEQGGLLKALRDGTDQATIDSFNEYLGAFSSRLQPGPFDITDTDKGGQILALSRGSPDDREQAREMLDALPGKIENGRVVQDFRIETGAKRSNNIDFGNPAIRRDLVKLQLLDALCAQGDRHMGNYVVRFDENGGILGLQGIDNDQAFGTRIGNPNDLMHGQGAGTVGTDGLVHTGFSDFNGVMLPSVVDRDMKDAFDAMTPDTLRASLAGLLPPEEIEVAVQRLGVIKAHLEVLETNGMVINPDEWGSERATLALQDERNSYVARDQISSNMLLQMQT